MGNIAFKLPNNAATFRYSFRETGGAWPADVLMIGGNKDHLVPFTSPACDELRITATYTTSADFILAHLSKLSITTGLSFQVLTGVGSVTLRTTTAQATPTNPVRRHDQSIAIADLTANQVQIIITGIGQAKLDIGQIVFSSKEWTPSALNYDNGAQLGGSYTYQRAQSTGGSTQSITSKLRSHSATFERLTDTEYKALIHIINYDSVGGLFVYQKDTASALTEDSYLAQIMLSGNVTETLNNQNQLGIDIIEAVS